MSKKQTEEERYRLTLKGLLLIYLPDSHYPQKASEVFNAIELYCRRHCMGIAINEENTLDFVEMQQVEETK
jgi:hypothetical protein